MKALYTSLIVAFSVGLGACAAQVPSVEQRPLSVERKMWLAQHWEEIADQVTQRLATVLAASHSPEKPLVLYVKKPQAASTFNSALHDLLITHLLGQGFGVSDDPSEGLPVAYDVQVITHNVPQPPPDTEVLITTSVLSGDRYLARVSDIYFIPNYNLAQYLAQAPTVAMEVVGP
jgi:hypothetical protein